MATKAAVDTDGRLEFHRTDVKGHQLHLELQVISFAEALSSRRKLTSSGREVRCPVAVVLAVSDTYYRNRVHLALKSDYFSLDL
jgi:hypothetical protein